MNILSRKSGNSWRTTKMAHGLQKKKKMAANSTSASQRSRLHQYRDDSEAPPHPRRWPGNHTAYLLCIHSNRRTWCDEPSGCNHMGNGSWLPMASPRRSHSRGLLSVCLWGHGTVPFQGCSPGRFAKRKDHRNDIPRQCEGHCMARKAHDSLMW